MIVAVIGSREFRDRQGMFDALDEDLCRFGITEVVSGGAGGADTYAAEWADSRGIPITVLAADWQQHGQAAGVMRNTLIIERAELVICFWDGRSTGSRDSVFKAIAKGIPVLVYPFDVKEHRQKWTPNGVLKLESGM